MVVIEAPGKVAQLSRALRAVGVLADVWPTGGHFRQHAASLWPLGILSDGSEPGRLFDQVRFAELRRHAIGRRVIVATDADQEGDVIARDVRAAVVDVAASIERVRLNALDSGSVRTAFAAASRLQSAPAGPGDARRLVDRLIGHSFSRPGRPVGRVFSAMLKALREHDPVVGHVTLLLPATDGGAPFTASVPVTASTRALWEARAREPLPAVDAGAVVDEAQRKPWNFAQTILRGVLRRPLLRGEA